MTNEEYLNVKPGDIFYFVNNNNKPKKLKARYIDDTVPDNEANRVYGFGKREYGVVYGNVDGKFTAREYCCLHKSEKDAVTVALTRLSNEIEYCREESHKYWDKSNEHLKQYQKLFEEYNKMTYDTV